MQEQHPEVEKDARSEDEQKKLKRALTSSGGIYALIIVAGMIVVSRDLAAASADVFWSVAATLLVLFLAHAYAATVSWLVGPQGNEAGLLRAVRNGLEESLGMLIVGAIPIAFLALGMLGVIGASEAVWCALIVDLILLAALGWWIAATRTTRLAVRLASVITTALLGGGIVLIKALLHI
ncbi:MAG: hypothetical protein E2601_06440 [Microbacterium sp.]|nr:hypothetical protein [Microbacterium sp.]